MTKPMGENMKSAYGAIRKALKRDTAAEQFNSLRNFCMEQAHMLDGDDRCLVCNRWIPFGDLKTQDEDGVICQKCES